MRRITCWTLVLLAGLFGFSESVETDNGTLEFTVDQGDLVVDHLHYSGSCDLTFSSSVRVEADTVDVMEYVDEVGTCCICYYDFRTVVEGLAPGAYLVRVWDGSSMTYLGGAEVVIEGESASRGAAGEVLYTYSDSGCYTDY